MSFRPSRDKRRQPVYEPIGPDHVLASAAFPFLFPARKIGSRYYADGGLRFNTPIAPAIRVGAERLVVVSLKSPVPVPAGHEQEIEAAYPRPVFLIGKLLSAMLLDPVEYDLQVLGHLNRLMEILEQSLEPEVLDRVRTVQVNDRGLGYRRVKTLVFAPTQNVAHMASEHGKSLRLRGLSSWFLDRMTKLSNVWESDLLSFIMFDSDFTQRLIELGRHDALVKADEILQFFAPRWSMVPHALRQQVPPRSAE